MTLARYSTYKESGISWLGSVPSHWNIRQLRQLGRLLKGSGGSKEDIVDSGFHCVRYGDIYTTHSFSVRSARTRISAERSTDYTPIKHGDVLFAASGEKLEEIGKSVVNLIDEPAFCGGDMIILRPSEALHPVFSGYATDSNVSALQKASMGRGTTVKHIYPDELKLLILCVPPIDEQVAIADFLDRETAKIDALVAEQERLIELLKEKRQAVISHAVTKGLNPSAPMKDSNAEWLGRIPAHWDQVPLKHAADFFSGGTPSKARADYWDGEIPWASSKDLKSDELSDTEDRITKAAVADGARLVNAGDLMVVVRGMILAHTFPVTKALVPMAINQDLKGIRPKHNWSIDYFAHLLRAASPETLRRLDEAGHGTKALRMEAWTGMLLPCPPADEQRAIAGFVSRETSAMDALGGEARRAIGLLQERRSALISAAVTGQIDVRNSVGRER